MYSPGTNANPKYVPHGRLITAPTITHEVRVKNTENVPREQSRGTFCFAYAMFRVTVSEVTVLPSTSVMTQYTWRPLLAALMVTE